MGLRVNITHIEMALDIPVTQEVLHEPESNVVKVAFTVRKAGRYEVAVKLGGLNVAYSPYYKTFQPGITSTPYFAVCNYSFGMFVLFIEYFSVFFCAHQVQLSHPKPK